MNNPVLGMAYLIEGFGLIAKPGLRRFVVIPLLINIFLFIGLFFLLRHFVFEFNQWFANYLPAWLQWLGAILWLVFILSFFMFILYGFVTVANLLSAPFNSFLAEKVEYHLTGNIPESRSLLDNIKDIPRIMGRQLSIIGYYLPRALLLFILCFIPVLGAFAVLLSFLFHAWFLALTYLDYPTDNHRIPMYEVRTWMKQRRGVSLGFGICVLTCSMFPIVNCFTIPAAVAGATKCWLEESKPQ